MPAKKQKPAVSDNSLDELVIEGIEDVSIDLSSIGLDNMNYTAISGGYDSITLNSGISNIDIPTITSGVNNYYYTTSAGTGGGSYTITPNTILSPSTVNINEQGIDVNSNGDIKVGGKSLKEFMEKMESRLAILQPNPEKLEHFEALRKAYEHYKTLEALCELPKKEEK